MSICRLHSITARVNKHTLQPSYDGESGRCRRREGAMRRPNQFPEVAVRVRRMARAERHSKVEHQMIFIYHRRKKVRHRRMLRYLPVSLPDIYFALK
jgi:hypothetical protein